MIILMLLLKIITTTFTIIMMIIVIVIITMTAIIIITRTKSAITYTTIDNLAHIAVIVEHLLLPGNAPLRTGFVTSFVAALKKLQKLRYCKILV